MVLVEPLHLPQESRLLLYLGQVVNGLVKDRNVATTNSKVFTISIFFRYLLIGSENGLGALHGWACDLGQVLPQTFLGRGVRVIESRVDLRVSQNGSRLCFGGLLFLAVRGLRVLGGAAWLGLKAIHGVVVRYCGDRVVLWREGLPETL